MPLLNSQNIDPDAYKDMKVAVCYEMLCNGYRYENGTYIPFEERHTSTEWRDAFWNQAYNAWLVQIADSGALYRKVQDMIVRTIGDEWTQASKYNLGDWEQMQVVVTMYALQDGVTATQKFRTDLSQYY